MILGYNVPCSFQAEWPLMLIGKEDVSGFTVISIESKIQ
jgi:hypothetical protein